MFLHLVHRNRAHAGLQSLSGEVFETSFWWNPRDEFDTVLQKRLGPNSLNRMPAFADSVRPIDEILGSVIFASASGIPEELVSSPRRAHRRQRAVLVPKLGPTRRVSRISRKGAPPPEPLRAVLSYLRGQQL